MTLRALATELGISASYLSDIEKGNRNPPSFDRLNQIAKLLQLDYWDHNRLLKLAGKNYVPHISVHELTHRICNGFNSHWGYVTDENGKPRFVKLWEDRGIDQTTPEFAKIFETYMDIIYSIPTVDAIEAEYTDYHPTVKERDFVNG